VLALPRDGRAGGDDADDVPLVVLQLMRTQWCSSSSTATHSALTSAMNAGDLYASRLVSHDSDMAVAMDLGEAQQLRQRRRRGAWSI
jgi:hypothetical protein